MIISREPISMSESLAYLGKEEQAETKAFVKKFVKLDDKKAKELREKLEGLDILKLNEMNIPALIDFLPQNKEELNKVLSSANLDEDETNKVLQTVKEY